jgi:hypothetical protein
MVNRPRTGPHEGRIYAGWPSPSLRLAILARPAIAASFAHTPPSVTRPMPAEVSKPQSVAAMTRRGTPLIAWLIASITPLDKPEKIGERAFLAGQAACAAGADSG